LIIKSDDDLPPSKSQRKRDMTALQKMGETLVSLPAGQLAKIPLEATLRDAIMQARELTAHGAIRRQLQYIGKLMRFVDPEPIQAALDDLESKSKKSKAEFHLTERWRDRLIAEDDPTIQSFIDQFPHAGRQHLRQLVRNAKKRTTADTELFRYLRKVMEEK
jgi:ribosome-associated protein